MDNIYKILTWDWKEPTPTEDLACIGQEVREKYGDFQFYEVNTNSDQNAVIITNVLDLTKEKIDKIYEQYENRENDEEFEFVDYKEIDENTYYQCYGLYSLIKDKQLEIEKLLFDLHKKLDLDRFSHIEDAIYDSEVNKSLDSFDELLKLEKIKLKKFFNIKD